MQSARARLGTGWLRSLLAADGRINPIMSFERLTGARLDFAGNSHRPPVAERQIRGNSRLRCGINRSSGQALSPKFQGENKAVAIIALGTLVGYISAGAYRSLMT